MKNLVIDIQRCSIHDGPGIRTTVFLKGCPLRCQWCHNQESQSYEKELSFNIERCSSCGECIKECPEEAHYIKEGIHKVNYDKCKACGKCIETCHQKALSIVGKELDIDEIMKVIKKDINFYKNSKGGVTISGGEALTNIELTKNILVKCKEVGIHTCIETSGFAKKDNIDFIVEYVDLFLYDYKLTGEELHKKYIGVSNEIILENLEYISSLGKEIILRCPIIPDVNDFKEHFEAIRSLGEKLEGIKKVELLPYHDFGVIKGKNIGKEVVRFRVPSKVEKEEWKNFFKDVSFDFKIN